MPKIYTPISIDLHKVGKVEVQTVMHNAGDGTKPEDDFAVVNVRVYRDDGTHAITLSSFFMDGGAPVINILPMKECRVRMQSDAQPEADAA